MQHDTIVATSASSNSIITPEKASMEFGLLLVQIYWRSFNKMKAKT